MTSKALRLHAAAIAAATLTASVLAAGAAQATQVFSDNFNSENGGVAANPYTSFVNWTVTGGEFTLVEGARCEGGSGGCVGLDGRGGGPVGNEFNTTASFAYSAGSQVTVSYDIAGSHADCGSCANDDQYEAGILWGTVGQTVNDLTVEGFDQGTFTDSTGIILFGNGFAVPRTAPWTTHTFSFTATEAGSFQFDVRSYSVDGIGPLMDNVTVDVTGGVPEPATWALMILGFGAAGAALRRRREMLAA
ncbi:MAG: PEPxxWA-CTERM sorting domain-containing protein [Proteobacteria bacterium]|nr:PEPxxWA-CTERM sorting domain-containing protein [Pseudomonadota bacterium]